ncbi:hypothetical protein [Paracoccus sp. FO-3]|uniref:hypothetical protein n=1 Tax=Paracoccus sp. FO-3 TaxID=1335059 RepID=UPI00112BBD1E|nr:hypothetical protein [Paracoccus sp. FO-3]
MLVSSSIAGWVAYDEPGFSNSVGMPTICFWRAVSLCFLCLIFLFFELVAPWAALPEAFLGLLSFGSLLSFFLSRGNGMGGGRCPPQGAPFLFLDF